MANGRSIKRKMAKNQKAQAPEEQALAMGPEEEPMGQGFSREEFLEGAQQGASYEGRAEHLKEMMDPQQMQDIPPGMMKQLETINAAMVDMIYDPKTKGQVQKTLQDGPPEMTVPAVTNMIMGRFEDIMRPKNGNMSLDMKLAVGVNTFSEIQDLASRMGILPKEVSEDQQQAMLKSAMQQYIQKGLKDKSIDPVELQMAVEPLLTPEEQLIGRGVGEQTGTPGGPTNQIMQQDIMNKKLAPKDLEIAQLKKQNQGLQGALKGVQMTEGGRSGERGGYDGT
jgi:hypothetical protein